MGRRASKHGHEDRNRKLSWILARALAIFLGGVLLFLFQRCWGWLNPPTPTPTPTPTVMLAEILPTAPSITPTNAVLPTPTSSATPSPIDSQCPQRPDQTRGAPFLYRVRRGDTVSWLSDCFNVSQDALMHFNWIDDPTDLFAGTYIIIPPPASRGGEESPQTMLLPQEQVAIEAFNAMLADIFAQWPYEPGSLLTNQYGGSEAVQSAVLWVYSVLQPYNPTTVLSATYDWNLPPTVADPDFGWKPWERGAYATVRWRVQIQCTDGVHAELTLYQSVHYGLGALQTSSQVTRFETFINRYGGVTAMRNLPD